MVLVNLVVMFIIGVCVGVAIAYTLFQKQISQQQQTIEGRIRQEREEQEKSHQIRQQQTVQQLQQEHQNQLQQVRQTVETEYQAQLEQIGIQLQEKDTQIQQVSQSLTESETQQQQLTEQLQQSEAQITELNQILTQYQTMLEQVNAELEASQAQVQASSQSFGDQEVQSPILTEESTPAVELTLTLPETSEETPVVEEEVPEQQLTVIEVESPTIAEAITESTVVESPTVSEIITESTIAESSPVSEIITDPAIIKAEKITLPPIKATSEEQLIEQILTIGTSGNLAAINTLTGYLQHSNPQVRYAVAATLGKITASRRLSREVQQTIPILTRLSQDLDPRVRQEAIIALGNIPSHQVIPILQKALRDTQSSVAQSASIALNKFKVYRVRPKSQPKALMLRKPNISSNPK